MWWAQFWAGLLIVFPIGVLIISEVTEVFVRYYFGVDKVPEEEDEEDEDRGDMSKYAVDPEMTSDGVNAVVSPTMPYVKTSYSRNRPHQKNGELKKSKKKKKKKKKKEIKEDKVSGEFPHALPSIENKKDT